MEVSKLEIEVGEYVRTSLGIIYKLTKKKQEQIENYPEFLQYIEQKSIAKHSFNIIDLIEEGDYVNGYKVDFVQGGWVVYNHNHPYKLNILAENIKSICTKEQFENISYKVEG